MDDPFVFGQIAAANSLSDVYAMGGQPVTAMNIVCFPVNLFPVEVLRETLAGGISKIEEAGAVLAGGHSVEDDEFKYGLSVTGIVNPSRILRNSGAREGDMLILTKPLEWQSSTVVKAGIATDADMKNLALTASALNKDAAAVMLKFDVGACTDITGFGLAGHAREMASGSGLDVFLKAASVPVLDGALDYADMGLIPGGCHRTRAFCSGIVKISDEIPRNLLDIMFDPQTSGGLLFSVKENDAHVCLDEMRNSGIKASIVGLYIR